jgi:3-hydroxyisobutyrate dehydrogenase-like beta-hydroxyacid dehydrogenase
MPRKHRKNVGLIGLGIIGARAAAGLRAAGFRVYVWNRTVKPEPNFLPNPADVAAVCDIIQIFVSDAAALMEVLRAMKEKLTRDHIVVCNATIGQEATMEAAKFVQEAGARFLDAPFTGSKVAAERRQLVYYVGGDEETYLRVKPVLEATSKAIIRVGRIGDAAVIKVVTNMISAVSIQALAEALAIVKKAGLPAESLVSALEHNAARSGTMDLKLPKMLAGDYEPHFSLKHMFKDVQLGMKMADGLQVDAPASAVTAGTLFSGVERGWGDDDFAALFRMYEDRPSTPALRDREESENETPEPANPEIHALGAPADKPGEPALESEEKRDADNEPELAADEPKSADEPVKEKPSHIFARIFGEDNPPKP